MRILFGGGFDLIHRGHVEQIERIKQEYPDSTLIVNISSDEQVRNKKGKERPIIPENDRLYMTNAIKWVDEVVCLPTKELDLESLIEKTRPDILITNSDNLDYDETCSKLKVEIKKLPRVIAPSKLDTTKIIQKIKNS